VDGCADADDARILATEGVVVPERGSGDGRRDVGQTDDEIVRSPSCTTVHHHFICLIIQQYAQLRICTNTILGERDRTVRYEH